MHTSHDILLTVAAAVAAGVMLVVVARRFDLPSIVLLLIGGIALGPTGLGLVQPDTLGQGLQVVVAISVGLILFEGGLTLDLEGYRSAPGVIRRLLSLGVLVTWGVTAAAIALLVGLPPPESVLAGSLVIVTGPTVIGPLLKRVKVTAKLHGILHWEGVLIDPIGVFIALLCYEWIIERSAEAALLAFAVRVGLGLAVGIVGGIAIAMLVRRRVIHDETINVFALGGAVLIFGVAEWVQAEAGLLAVTAAGFVFSLSDTAQIKQIRVFKGELTDLLIGTLFILLAARLSFDQFKAFGLAGLAVVVIVLLVVRPLSVALCTMRSDLSRRERLFLSWVAPRGIVAASMASLFAIRMEELGFDQPRFVETFTYSVIMATVVLQGLTAGTLARWLGVLRTQPTGWLIVGGHAMSRRLAAFVSKSAGVQAIVIDTNSRAVQTTRREGIPAIIADARDVGITERPELQGIGNILAATDNEDLNVRICQNWAEVVGVDHVFRCQSAGVDQSEEDAQQTGRIVWSSLPPPSLVSRELERGDARWQQVGNEAVVASSAIPMALTSAETVVLDPTPEQLEDPPEGAQRLYLRRRGAYLRRSLDRGLVMTLDVADRRALVQAMVERVCAVRPELPVTETARLLLEGDAAFPAALGNGVAVLHAYTPSLGVRVSALARVPDGIDFEGVSDEPARLIFLVLSPERDAEGHLATLAEVARLVSDPERLERMMAAASERELLDIIRSRLGR